MGRLALVIALALAGCASPALEVHVDVDDPAEVDPEAGNQPAHWVHLRLPEVRLSAALALDEGVLDCALTPESRGVWRIRWTDRARKEGTLLLVLRDSDTLALFDPAVPARDQTLDDPVLGTLVACNRPEVLGDHWVRSDNRSLTLVLQPGGDYAPRRPRAWPSGYPRRP